MNECNYLLRDNSGGIFFWQSNSFYLRFDIEYSERELIWKPCNKHEP